MFGPTNQSLPYPPQGYYAPVVNYPPQAPTYAPLGLAQAPVPQTGPTQIGMAPPMGQFGFAGANAPAPVAQAPIGPRPSIDDLMIDAEQECIANTAIPPQQWVEMSKLVQGLRPSKPATYTGTDHSVKTLETFVHNVIDYFRATRMLRSELTIEMVIFIGSCLGDDAKEWYKNNVAMTMRLYRWTPRAVFIGLRNRFIQENDLSESAREFDA